MKTVFYVVSTILCPISIVLLILLGTGFCILGDQYKPSRGVQLVNAVLGTSAKIIKDKYKIRPVGEGVTMPGGPIQELFLAFDTKAPCTREELRELLINCANEILDQVNKNEDIQQYLMKPPFTIENVQIIIVNRDKDGFEVYDPGISTAQILQGILSFATVDAGNTFKYKNEFTETYEEALEAVRVGHEKVSDQENDLPADRAFSFPSETTKQVE